MGFDVLGAAAGGGSGGGTVSAGTMYVNVGGNTSGTTANISTGTFVLAGGNNITLSQVANAVTISGASQSLQTQSIVRDVNIGGNTSGATTDISSGTMTLAGGTNVTLNQAGNAITINAVQGGTQSFWNPYSNAGVTKVTVFGQSTLLFVPVQLPFYLTASRANLFVSASVSTSSNSSHAGTLSYALALYSLNVSTLSLASSGSVSYVWTITSSNSSDSMSDEKMFSVPININATPGNWFIAHLSQTASANANWITFSNGMVNAAKVIGSFASGNTVNMAPGWGHYSAATAAFPATEHISKILGGAQFDNSPVLVNFMNITG